MSATIYCFSSTGNSLEIARQIADRLGDCTISPMAALHMEKPVGGPGQTMGFVFPVYYMGLPRLVRRFAERINILDGTYCFAVASSGGSGGDALGMLQEILQKKGIILSFAEEITMPGSYIVKYQAPAPGKVNDIIAAARTKVKGAAGDIARGVKRPVQRRAAFFSKVANNKYLYAGIAAWDGEFTAENGCTGCGVCAEVCPVSNIRIMDGHPAWQHCCEHCLACIQWCPCEAIQYGNKTIARRRYHHPNVAAGDIANLNSPY